MADYTITVRKTYSITARNLEQARERAEYILDHLELNYNNPSQPKAPKWLGDEQESESSAED